MVVGNFPGVMTRVEPKRPGEFVLREVRIQQAVKKAMEPGQYHSHSISISRRRVPDFSSVAI